MTNDMDTAQVLNTFFASLFTIQTGLQESQAPETRGKVWSKEGLLSGKEEEIREHLKKLHLPKATGTDGMHHPPVLRRLADVIVRPLPIIS